MKHSCIAVFILFCQLALAQMRPIIGLSDTYKDGVSTVPRTYIEAVVALGGIPVIIPLINDDDRLAELLETLDGVIFTGGGDFDPAYYHEKPIPQNGKPNAARDEFDIRLLKLAVNKGVPTLGICRGLQLINIAFGGSLYQDLPAQYPNKSVAHRQSVPFTKPSHAVIVQDGTAFAEIVGKRRIEVNSAHHQAVKKLASGFRIAGKSTDGVVEAIEKIDSANWVLGVQFHPEALYAMDKTMGNIIRSLVDEAALARIKRNASQIVYIPVETKEKSTAATTNTNTNTNTNTATVPDPAAPTAAPPAKPDTPRNEDGTLRLDKSVLFDKIKGGWAGQTLGVCYGAPTEFRWTGNIIPDTVTLGLNAEQIQKYFNNDDIYMDVTFVSVIERLGIDAPADSFALAFANAGYNLWHANQSARYNIMHGLLPPASGHWLNNPHADDIDYQIESDFAGLMSPGMPNAASAISDRIGHIMNYGDGWYGGVFVGALYAIAFTSDDIPFIVQQALMTIPENSRFHKCIRSVIDNYYKYPDDWKKAWQLCENDWSNETGCPDGVYLPFNIDASLNAAYIVLGLLYGKGDFYLTLEIATRAGQDSDCNPASAAGILGVIKGYSNLPADILKPVEDTKLDFTDYSLNDVSRLSFKHALENISRNGGYVNDSSVIISIQKPQPVRFEQSFEKLLPKQRIPLNSTLTNKFKLRFNGCGIVIRGGVNCTDANYTAQVQVSINGKIVETVELPADFRKRRNELFWNYQLKERKFKLELKWLNPRKDAMIRITDALIYSAQK